MAIRENVGGGSLPGKIVPDLNLFGLCDTGWIFSHDLEFALAAFLFFGGTILAFYTSLGVFGQIAGFLAFYETFGSAGGAVMLETVPAGLPSGFGPKLALISMILVFTGLLFPIYLWSKVKLKSIWRRFLTIAPESNVKQAVPLVYAAAGSVAVALGQVVDTSSAYGDATVSYVLFTLAGLVLLAVGMFALIVAWKTD